MNYCKNMTSALALVLILAITLGGCSAADKSAAPAPEPPATAAPELPDAVAPEATPQPTADPLADYSVIGPWSLSAAKNDMAALYTVFGSSLRDYGASMEIKGDGQMQISVGIAGGAGTYTRDGSLIAAQITTYNESAQETVELRLTEDAGEVYLTCTVYDTLLWWTQNEEDAAGAPQPAADSAYNELLSLYRAALTEQYDDLKLSEAGLNYMLMFFYNGDALSNVGYIIRDFDADGTPELLVSAINGEAFYTEMVLDLYTLRDGAPVQLFSGGERDRYYTLSDGSFYNEGSNGAAESLFRQLTLSGGELTEPLLVYYNSSAASEWTVSRFGGAAEGVSSDEATGLMDAFQAQITKLEYTPFGA